MTDIRDYSPRLKDCILHLVVGERLGGGSFRNVYALDDKRVLKVEPSGSTFCNHQEWMIWQEVVGGKWEKWFAPCLDIDTLSGTLIQRRTTPLTDRQWNRLKEVPNFMADIKRANWGMLDGRIVCHDYGNHKFYWIGLGPRAKLIPAAKHGD